MAAAVLSPGSEKGEERARIPLPVVPPKCGTDKAFGRTTFYDWRCGKFSLVGGGGTETRYPPRAGRTHESRTTRDAFKIQMRLRDITVSSGVTGYGTLRYVPPQ